MIYPGLKKLGKELGFKNNGHLVYGFINNTYVAFMDGSNRKFVYFRFPSDLDEEDKNKLLSWKKKGYAKNVIFSEGNIFDVEFEFTEYFVPFKISKIKEVIEDIANYFNEKYADRKPVCCGDNCNQTENLVFYDVDTVPVFFCPSCKMKLENRINNEYEELQEQPNNYLKGTAASILFSIPGHLVTFIFFWLGKIAAVSGLLYFFLAQKGFTWAKGKLNKIGVLIISLLSLINTVIGTFISYIAVVVIKILKLPEAEGVSVASLIRFSLESLQDNEVRRELFVNIGLSLILCGICIVIKMIELLKSSGKTKIQKI